MQHDDIAGAAAGLVAVLILVLLAGHSCSRDGPEVVIPPDPNEKLAEVARQSVEAAREAQAGEREARKDAAAVREASGRWTAVAFVAAAVIPLAIALLLFKFYANTPPGDAEVLAELHRLAEPETRPLPAARRRSLAAPADTDGPAHSDERT